VGNLFDWLFSQQHGLIGVPFHYLFYQPVFNVLMGVYLIVHNFALAIVILTVVMRLAIYPLYRAQLKSSQEMQRLQPRIAELKRQYQGDTQGFAQAQQALFREHGYNPASGCLPLLVQFPVLYALYYSFFNVLKAGSPLQTVHNINDSLYPFMPHFTLATLPDTHFLWMNLALPDPYHILPILAGVLTFLQLRMAMPVRKPQPRGQTDAMAQSAATSMAMMQYVMPFITVFIGWGFPSGLALYWCVSTLFSGVQQYFISGWGSLFVGIPYLERFTPPPKDLPMVTPPAATTRGGSTRSVTSGGTSARGPAGARALVPASRPEPQGGLRGLWHELRESFAAAQAGIQTTGTGAATTTATPQVTNAEARTGADVGGDAAAPPASRSGRTPGETADYIRARRARAARPAPMLVKPVKPSSPTLPAAGQPTTLPEDEIAQAGASTVNGKPVLPEEAIAGDNNAGSGAVAGGANGTTGANGASQGGQDPRAPGSSSSTSKSAQTYRKGSQGRPRNDRPKGGR
jgi:YidC/Oxa1 family membrane protein insertase